MNYRNGRESASDGSPANDLAQQTTYKSFADSVLVQKVSIANVAIVAPAGLRARPRSLRTNERLTRKELNYSSSSLALS
jgi:hypothetical protein